MFKRPMLVLFFLSLLTACAGMPISSMLKMRNIEPLEMDPAQIKIAVITDSAVKLGADSTSLTLGFRADLTGVSFSSQSVASIVNQAKVPELEAEKLAGQDITLFYLDDQAAAKMRAAQDKIKVIRQQEIDGEGSMSVSVNSGCFNSKRPERLLASIFVQFSEAQGFIEMQSNVDLLERAGDEDFWVECGEAGS